MSFLHFPIVASVEPIQVGIVGATGYSGEVLLRLLARHPQAQLSVVASRSHAGSRVEDVMPMLRGRLGNLSFSKSEPQELAATAVPVFFLALPHGVAAEFALPLVEAGKTVIDLSADFRLHDPATYAEAYAHPHPAPEWLARTPYVVPEIQAYLGNAAWKQSRLIACPGCYPTSVQVPLYPLLRAGLIEPQGLVVNSMSGISGAGKQAKEFYSFGERALSASAYGAPRHRHAAEMEEQLSQAAGQPVVLQFTPHLIPLHTGIATTIVARARGSLDAVYAAWSDAYPPEKTPFVKMLSSGTFPETKFVLGTNRVDMSAVFDARTGNFVITSAIDNLVKGASGQAVQIFNLLHNLPQTEGLL